MSKRDSQEDVLKSLRRDMSTLMAQRLHRRFAKKEEPKPEPDEPETPPTDVDGTAKMEGPEDLDDLEQHYASLKD